MGTEQKGQQSPRGTWDGKSQFFLQRQRGAFPGLVEFIQILDKAEADGPPHCGGPTREDLSLSRRRLGHQPEVHEHVGMVAMQ